jgi:hypothetical protein
MAVPRALALVLALAVAPTAEAACVSPDQAIELNAKLGFVRLTEAQGARFLSYFNKRAEPDAPPSWSWVLFWRGVKSDMVAMGFEKGCLVYTSPLLDRAEVNKAIVGGY